MEVRNHTYAVFMLVLSVFALGAMAVETTTSVSPGTQAILGYADKFICGLFFLDFVYLLSRSKNRGKYLLTWGWLDLLSCIPVIPSLRWSRAARAMRLLRVLRGVRSVRILVRVIVEKKIQSTAMAALLLTTIFITVAAISVLHFEAGEQGATITTPEDAIWWSIYTTMTLGFGDKFPLTTEGRAVAALLASLGYGLLAMCSGFVASWIVGSSESETATKLDEVRRELAEIKDLLRAEASTRGSRPSSFSSG